MKIAASPTGKKGSPIRPNLRAAKRSNKISKRVRYTIEVLGIPTMPYELYFYSKGEGRDAYQHNIKSYIDSEDGEEIPLLEDGGFTMYFTRRVSVQFNEPLVGDDNWKRIVIVRMLPGLGESSATTRTEGLNILRTYFMDARYSRYPPPTISTVDRTDEARPVSMNHHLLDENVLQLMIDTVDPVYLDNTFYTDNREWADLFFSGNYPDECILQYGYPGSLNNRNPNAPPNAAWAAGVDLHGQINGGNPEQNQNPAAANEDQPEDDEQEEEDEAEGADGSDEANEDDE